MERRTWWVGDISHESECSLSLRGAKRGVQRGGRAGTQIGAAILLSGEVTHRGLRPAAASGPSGTGLVREESRESVDVEGE